MTDRVSDILLSRARALEALLRAAAGIEPGEVITPAKARALAVARVNNLPHLLLGSGRHSFTTWCRTPGIGVRKVEPPQPAVSLEDVAAVTGHRSVSTTRFHYDEADHIPHMLEVPLRLAHPDDPPVDQVMRLGAVWGIRRNRHRGS